MLSGTLSNSDYQDLIQLFDSIRNGDEDSASALLDEHITLANLIDSRLDDVSPLICAVQYPQIEPSFSFFNKLITLTSNINAQNNLGFTALHFLCAYDRTQLLTNLFESKGDAIEIDLQNKDGNTACFIAASNNAPEALYLLLQNNADPHIANSRGQTPLHFACFKGNLTCVELLLESGAKVDALDLKNRTPMHYLSQCKKSDTLLKQRIFECLVEHGAQTHDKSLHGKTALDMVNHFQTGERLAHLINQHRVPSLFNLCTRFIAKELNDSNQSTDYLNLPEPIADEVKKIRKSIT